MKKININRVDFSQIAMSDLANLLEDWEFQILLHAQPLIEDTDIMLENMLDYFVEEELYNYACVVRYEIEKRKPLK